MASFICPGCCFCFSVPCAWRGDDDDAADATQKTDCEDDEKRKKKKKKAKDQHSTQHRLGFALVE